MESGWHYLTTALSLSPAFILDCLWSQLRPLPPASGDFSGKTVVVTGGNGSLGREAIRHFLNLGAAKVILGCRDAEKGEAARRDVVGCASTIPDEPVSSGGKATVEVWNADLCSFESVKAFCRRAENELERIDVLVCNAGLLTDRFVEADGGWEAAIAVNVISTFLMAIMLLPKMRETAMKFNTLPRIVVVSSVGHFLARFPERRADDIFATYRDPAAMSADRYQVTKLLQVLCVREMANTIEAHAVPASATMPPEAGTTAKPPVLITAVNPGLCKSGLFGNLDVSATMLFRLGNLIVGRTAEAGSRTIVAGAVAGEEAQGKYMDSCAVSEPSNFARSEEGKRVGKKAWEELLEVLNGIAPGVADNL